MWLEKLIFQLDHILFKINRVRKKKPEKYQYFVESTCPLPYIIKHNKGQKLPLVQLVTRIWEKVKQTLQLVMCHHCLLAVQLGSRRPWKFSLYLLFKFLIEYFFYRRSFPVLIPSPSPCNLKNSPSV